MHKSSMTLMAGLLKQYAPTPGSVLDVGAYDVNGTYRDMCEAHGLAYHGLDLSNGPNVDIVAESPYRWPVDTDAYDLVISGQCLEHVEMPWLWLLELKRVCKPLGMIIVISPGLGWHIHRHPVDCWRILPDGMRALAVDWAGLDMVAIGICGSEKKPRGDCFGIFRKRAK